MIRGLFVILCYFVCICHYGQSEISGDHITIHIVTHTHDDTGWIISTDEYYLQYVQWIFYTMFPQLQSENERRFTYVEMAYLHRWWGEASEESKENVRGLVSEGQLQMNLGGWCMNDEACPSLSAIVRQMTDGQQFILKEFGASGRPRVAWHVDPFGHSYVTGGLWAQVGFDAFAMHRINFHDLEERKKEQNLEFVWKGSSSLGDEAYIFVHLLDSGYCTPAEINFPGGSVVINNDPSLPSFPTNYVQIAEEFVSDARNKNTWFRHSHMLIPYGCDFQHTNAVVSMLQMDKLMTYVNGNATYNATVIYSTLADYVEAVNELNLTWAVETEDLFDYVDNNHAWWTGYFTSRPQLKAATRASENVLRPAEQFYVWGKNLGWLDTDSLLNVTQAMNNISYLRHAIDVSQHHDGITGTETQHTTDDYMFMLREGNEKVEGFQEQIVGEFMKKGANGPSAPLVVGQSLLSYLDSSNVVVVVLYNSLVWQITRCIEIPANMSNLAVMDANGHSVPSQVNPVAPYQENPNGDSSLFTLFFLAQNLPPLSFATYFIHMSDSANVGRILDADYVGSSFKTGTGFYTLEFDDDDDGRVTLAKVQNNAIEEEFAVRNVWHQYVPVGGVYEDGLQNSGAYIFRPASDNRVVLASNDDSSISRESLAFREEFSNESPDLSFLTATHANARYTDTFGATVCAWDLDENTFEFKYYRLDGSNWGQSPALDFVVVDKSGGVSVNPQLSFLGSVEYGSIKFNTGANTRSLTTTFSNAYSSTPGFALSVRGTNCDSDGRYVAVVTALSQSSVTVKVRRVDSSDPVDEVLYVDWIAWNQGSVATDELHYAGSAEVGVPSGTQSVVQVNLTFGTDSQMVVNEPVVLYSLQQVSPSSTLFTASTTVSNGHKGFGLNLDPQSKASADTIYRVSYIAFERSLLSKEVSASVENTVIEGSLLSEVQQVWKENYSQTYRVFNLNASSDSDSDLRFVDVNVHLGPLDTGAEMTTKFQSSLDSEGTMKTGQNALEYVSRQYNPYIDERIAGNFFPTASQAYIADSNDMYRLATVANQAHGVASLSSGELELMLHRRCLSDDHRGVGEVLNETTHIEPRINVMVDASEEVSYLSRRLFVLQQYEPSLYFAVADSRSAWTDKYNTEWSAMGNSYPKGLPANVHLQELRYVYSANEYNEGLVLQLQHMFESGESAEYSVPESVNLTDLFDPSVLSISEATEMTLTANSPLSDIHRMEWNIQERETRQVRRVGGTMKSTLRGTQVTLNPRDIRTYVVNANV